MGRRSGSQEDMERLASTAGNVDMILLEELDSLVTEWYSNNSDNYEETE